MGQQKVFHYLVTTEESGGLNMYLRRICCMVLLLVWSAPECSPRDPDRSYERGGEAYGKKKYTKAEKHFRAVTQARPAFLYGHMFLAHSLFYQAKYKEAIPEYERSLAIGAESGGMDQLDERIVFDQLAMAYALNGQRKEAQRLLEGVIPKDPSYPMYYYIMSCIFAEQGDLDRAIANLELAFERKTNMLPGESFPNPRTDDSFTRYLGEERFEAALKEMGF